MNREPNPAVGQRWVRRGDGTLWRVIGRRRSGWVLSSGPGRVLVVGLHELITDFDHAGCDHDYACCFEHGTHTNPHRGCMLR